MTMSPALFPSILQTLIQWFRFQSMSTPTGYLLWMVILNLSIDPKHFFKHFQSLHFGSGSIL